MAAKKLDPAGWLALIAARAPALREAGVRSLTVDGVSVELAPYDPPAPKDARATAEEPEDLISDRAVYGLPENVPLPGFVRPRREENT